MEGLGISIRSYAAGMAIALLTGSVAQATQFFVGVDPSNPGRLEFSSSASPDRPAEGSAIPANTPSLEILRSRIDQLSSSGHFPSAGQQPSLTPEQIADVVAAILNPAQPDGSVTSDVPAWVADALARVPDRSSSDQAQAALRDMLGLDGATGAGSEGERRADAERAAHELLRARQQALQAERIAALEQQRLDRSRQEEEKERRLAELIRKHTEAQAPDPEPDPDPLPQPDRFENYPFSFAQDYTMDLDTDITRSGEYHGFARGMDFADNEIDGAVSLTFDLATAALSGRFDFGSTGLLHVSGNVDAGALNMELDSSQTSSFGGFELDPASAAFDGVSFFGPTGEEIGGYWGIDIEQGAAWGQFVTARQP